MVHETEEDTQRRTWRSKSESNEQHKVCEQEKAEQVKNGRYAAS